MVEYEEPTRTPSRLLLSREAMADALDFEAEWPAIDMRGLEAPLIKSKDRTGGALVSRGRLDRFADTLTDLGRLLDESQFGACFAYMLLRDFAVQRPDVDPNQRQDQFQMPADILGLLAPEIPKVSASRLFCDLHSDLLGHRYLSRWLAGQLLDAVLVREVAAMDRLAALLEFAVGEPKANDPSSKWRTPVLSPKFIEQFASRYGSNPAWDKLAALVTDEVTTWVREDVRGGFVHRRRWPSALTGDVVLSYSHFDADDQLVHDERPGLTASQHLGIVRMTWEQVLTPAVSHVVELLEQDPCGGASLKPSRRPHPASYGRVWKRGPIVCGRLEISTGVGCEH